MLWALALCHPPQCGLVWAFPSRLSNRLRISSKKRATPSCRTKSYSSFEYSNLEAGFKGRQVGERKRVPDHQVHLKRALTYTEASLSFLFSFFSIQHMAYYTHNYTFACGSQTLLPLSILLPLIQPQIRVFLVLKSQGFILLWSHCSEWQGGCGRAWSLLNSSLYTCASLLQACKTHMGT